MYILFCLGVSTCVLLGSRKHWKIIFKALMSALIKIPLLLILFLSTCWKNPKHLRPFCGWESHSKQLHCSNNITGELCADLSVKSCIPSSKVYSVANDSRHRKIRPMFCKIVVQSCLWTSENSSFFLIKKSIHSFLTFLVTSPKHLTWY